MICNSTPSSRFKKEHPLPVQVFSWATSIFQTCSVLAGFLDLQYNIYI